MLGIAVRIVALAAVYLLVLTSLHPADILVGLVLASVLVLAVRRGSGRGGSRTSARSTARRLAGIPMLVYGTVADTVRGTWTVAAHCLGRPIAPGQVSVPITAPTPGAATAWGIRVGIAPDSLVVDVDEDGQRMLLHVLDASDPDAVVAAQLESYRRYQRRAFG